MRSDVILAQTAEQKKKQHQHQQASVAPEPNAPQRGPTVRSVVQRVSSADAEEEEQQDRMAAARSAGHHDLSAVQSLSCSDMVLS